MNKNFKDRLNQILPRMQSQELINNSGLGNEIGFYIFDYPPEEELTVRDMINTILNQLAKQNPELKVANLNLFELIIDMLKNRKLLDAALKMQKEKGDEELRKALKGPLHEEKVAKAFVEKANPDNYNIVLMTGVGSVWPLLRSHTLLNSLHPLMKGTPLIVFYPGYYDGQSLSLFGKLKDNNYYRAFRLVS